MEIIIMTKFAVKQVLLVCIVPCLTIRYLFQNILTGLKMFPVGTAQFQFFQFFIIAHYLQKHNLT